MKFTPVKLEIIGILLVGLSSLIAMSFSSLLRDLKQDSVLYAINENISQIHCMVKHLHMETDKRKNGPDFPLVACNRAAMNSKRWSEIEDELKGVAAKEWYANFATVAFFMIGTGLFVAAKIVETKRIS